MAKPDRKKVVYRSFFAINRIEFGWPIYKIAKDGKEAWVEVWPENPYYGYYSYGVTQQVDTAQK
ncbi:MAG: hypothetical protein WCJ37_17445 [Syntrophus sp. (in: bacteria)]